MAGRRGYGERRRRAPFGRGRERGQRGIGTEGETRESGEGCKGSRGVRGTLGCLQRRAGKQEVAEASRARATPRPSGEEEDDRGSGDGLGSAGPGKLGRWPGGLLSLSFISSFLFLFSVVCFDLVLDTKSFFYKS